MMTHSSITIKMKQQGVALIASLIIMLLMTILAISVFRGNNLLEKIAGNTREKQRALQSAQDALLYAEWWVQQPSHNTTPVTCSTSTVPTSIQVCSNAQDPGPALANVSSLKFFIYTPPNMQSTSAGQTGAIVTSGATQNDVIYASSPGFVIHALPSIGSQPLYRITAIGFGGGGGANGTQAIIQSIFVVGGTKQTASLT